MLSSSMLSVNTRDQSIQEGNGLIRRMNSSYISTKSVGNKLKKRGDSSYVSPYIKLAEQRAQDRVASAKKSSKKKPLKVDLEWDPKTTPNALFDPTIRKQDIFRLQPRTRTPNSSSFLKQDSLRSDSPALGRNFGSLGKHLTMRTSGVI
jgi:hypothetical protein